MRLFTWRRRLIVIGTTIGMIALFGLLGYGADMLFHSQPFGTIIGFFVSFPVAQVLMVRLLKTDIKQDSSSTPHDSV
ncbi:hypothetical protein COX00_00475 [Candidatus Uhrbacteria bacterium CG22_combo_CG10-13_8_21_14_all_47_17]|uniref:Uncharacterized protein n=1 Tax=Candidatus Uhrbacteria bacterium CG22_combo_CG10-13_8_21_14_all_47_17 TaxID=1975041 RepID=A0A2H0BTG4_9BACT|nr:MAG: hypothetical protein COX00_00475 [Candidatus Uhrbacteria bacterium CG22_combo_CG10-13_8_21_14_all_47_17]